MRHDDTLFSISPANEKRSSLKKKKVFYILFFTSRVHSLIADLIINAVIKTVVYMLNIHNSCLWHLQKAANQFPSIYD